jgi:hypothetical protein
VGGVLDERLFKDATPSLPSPLKGEEKNGDTVALVYYWESGVKTIIDCFFNFEH